MSMTKKSITPFSHSMAEYSHDICYKSTANLLTDINSLLRKWIISSVVYELRWKSGE